MKRVVLFALILLIIPSALAANYYASPSGNDADPGTLAQPFRTVTRGVTVMQNGDTLYIRGGTYRLPEENAGSYTFNKAGATSTNFATIQNYPGERAVLLGSRATTLGGWEQWNATTWRYDIGSFGSGPKGFFLGSRRIVHPLFFESGERSHVNASMITENRWTLADVNGYRCIENAVPVGCYVYYWPPPGENPNENSYEIPQQGFLYQRTDYVVVKGLEIYYTQSSPIFSESADYLLFERNIFGHNSNGNDNAYGLRTWFSKGSVVRNNTFFDSIYWGGVVNSHAIVFMNTVPGEPNIVEYNTVRNPGGMGVSTKNGVSNLIVRYNTIYDTTEAIVSAGRRCEGATCYDGGNWSIYGNSMKNVTSGVVIRAASEANTASDNNRIFNNVFDGFTHGVTIQSAPNVPVGTVIANNIFRSGTNAIFLNNGGSGTLVDLDFFFPLFSSNNNLFWSNTYEYCLRRNWAGAEGSCVGYDLATMQSTYAREQEGIEANPQFAETTDYTLQSGSPAIDAADASFWNSDLADIGRRPNARNATPAASICEATGASRCFYVDAVNGDDDLNSGSFASPFESMRNFRRFYNNLGCAPATKVTPLPGDVIYLRGGVHSTVLRKDTDAGCNTDPDPALMYILTDDGTASNPITVKSYPGEWAILDANRLGRGLYMQGANHWRFENFEMRNLAYPYPQAPGYGSAQMAGGVFIEELSNLTIDGLIIHDADGIDNDNHAGLYLNRVDDLLVKNSIFYDNTDTLHLDTPATSYNAGNVMIMLGNRITFLNNTFYQTPPITSNITGMCIKHKKASDLMDSYFHVINNTFYRCKNFALSIGTHNLLIRGNVFYEGDGVAFRAENSNTMVNMTVEYNTFVGTDRIQEGLFRIEAFSNAYTPFFPIEPSNIIFRNNIIYDADTTRSQRTGEYGSVSFNPYYNDSDYSALRSALSMNNNCYYNPAGASQFRFAFATGNPTSTGGMYTLTTWQQQGFDTASIFADPLFVNAAAGNYRTQVGSPCEAMGAYATSSSTPPPLPTTRVGDLNQDGVVNISDVILIIQNFKRRMNYDTGADINSDGTVNIFDMVLLGRNWG